MFALDRRRVAARALLLLSSCVSSTDSLYDPPEPPWLPARPDPGREEACAACATDACADERTACLQDQGCLALLECRGRCNEPACLQTCTARHGYSAWYEDLWTCVVIDHCREACGSGENFACVDDYQAARADDEEDRRFPVRFRYKNPRTGLAYAYTGDERDEQFVAGARAESCRPPDLASSACQRIDVGIVGADDSVELDLVVHEVTNAFKGVVEVELDDPTTTSGTAAAPLFEQLGWRDRYLTPPFAEATEFRFYVFWRGWFRKKAAEALPDPIDFTTAAPLAFYLEDCMGAPASGVRFELPGVPEVEVLNQMSSGHVGEETDLGSAMVGDVPESVRRQALVVQAVQIDTDRVLAKRNDVYVRPGWTTHVWLAPSPR